MLGKRILTAAIGIPVAIYLINYGQWLFAITTTVLAFLGWHEYCVMMKQKQINVSYSLGFVSTGLLLAAAWLGNPQETVMILLFFTLFTLAKVVISSASFSVGDAAFTVLGSFYIGLPFAHMLLLRFTDSSVYVSTILGTLSAGAIYIWLAFIGTWASDTSAYFVGSLLGKHKLCPAISPGKTVEGSIGGLIGSILGVALIGKLFMIPITHAIAIGLIVGIAAPFGDLVESAVKRFAGVKDSGRVLPGHGGILDRFDSIMFAVPAVYYYIKTFILY